MDLTKNHQMKTEVQTFLVEETVPLIYDNDQLSEYNSLVAELGLTVTETQAENKSPNPFMPLNASLLKTLEVLCPVKEEVKSFKRQPIPLEILRLIKLAEDEKYFSKIEVWYDDKNPDPAVIGYGYSWGADDMSGRQIQNMPRFRTKEDAQKYLTDNSIEGKPYNYTWSSIKYIIGKWADVKESWEELKERAKARYIKQERNRLEEELVKIRHEQEKLLTTANNLFN